MTNATQNIETTDDILSDDSFLAELEAELNADSLESPEVDEIGADELIALENEVEETPEPKKKAAPKKKKTAEKKAESSSDADGAEAEAPAKEKRQSLSGMPPSTALHTALGDRIYKVCIVNEKMATAEEEARKLLINEYLIEEVDVLAKKVKEKAINAFQSVAGQATLSVYTQIAIDLLKDKGSLSGVDIKNKYLMRPYSPGTASAQSSQMMKLLPALHIAKREGNTLYLNEDSPLLELLSQ